MRRNDYDETEEGRISPYEKYAILTPSDVMDILGIGKNSTYALLNTGKLHGFRIGRSWRISSEALEEFMLSGHAEQ